MKKAALQLYVIILVIATAAVVALAQSGYKQPPKEIMDVLNAPAIPTTSVSPARDKIMMLQPLRYPPIAELAQPMLRLAGLRINPNTNALHRQPYSVKLTLKDISGGAEMPVMFPAGAKLFGAEWSPDGKHIAVGNITPAGVELWIVDTATGKARNASGRSHFNTILNGFNWADNNTVAAMVVPAGRGAAPAYQNMVPSEPSIQETSGRHGLVQTFEDLLTSPNDERLFAYYATSNVAFVDIGKGTITQIDRPALYDSADVSPDGKYILVQRIERPFSYQFPYNRFPRRIEVWNRKGDVLSTVASLPLIDSLPNGGVTTGPRGVEWIPTEASTLVWTEALDGGNPRTKAAYRDHLMTLAAPFTGQAAELLKVEQRFAGRPLFGERGLIWYSDMDRVTQHRRVFVADYHNPGTVRMVSDLNVNDRYNELGQPVMKRLPTGENVIMQSGDSIFLTGTGASPEGDRPFLRRFDLATGKRAQEIFRSGTDKYESFVAMLKEDGSSFITRRESVSEPPNLFIQDGCPATAKCDPGPVRAITNFTDPSPQLRGITKQLVKYKRADGVDLSFTLYLPPGYKPGTPLPTVIWAYPQEFTNASTAGQVTGSTNRFTQINGYSHLFFALLGYAVMDNATMPIVGDPQTMNDTFVDQIVSAAKAAIDKGVEMGVTDRDRVGVGGHSYGAFMTANLLAHSNLFRAGIARSGAYNRTLTPFGFQNERRTFWDAPDLYEKISPFFYADKIKDPLLMIHGEADDNTGTFPMQSERLYAAMSGLGGTARLVMLPLEAHGYIGKESTEHVLYEMINWFDKYVKNVKPRTNKVAEK